MHSHDQVIALLLRAADQIQMSDVTMALKGQAEEFDSTVAGFYLAYINEIRHQGKLGTPCGFRKDSFYFRNGGKVALVIRMRPVIKKTNFNFASAQVAPRR